MEAIQQEGGRTFEPGNNPNTQSLSTQIYEHPDYPDRAFVVSQWKMTEDELSQLAAASLDSAVVVTLAVMAEWANPAPPPVLLTTGNIEALGYTKRDHPAHMKSLLKGYVKMKAAELASMLEAYGEDEGIKELLKNLAERPE